MSHQRRDLTFRSFVEGRAAGSARAFGSPPGPGQSLRGDSSRECPLPAGRSAYAPKTIHALLSLATESVKVWQQTGLRLS
jgi:hypothetical protein